MASQDQKSGQAILGSLSALMQALAEHSREIQQRTGLTGMELFMLQQLNREPTSRPKALASSSMMEPEPMAEALRGLVAKGMVMERRSGKTGRILELWLSAEAKLKLRQCPDSLQFRLLHAVQRVQGERRKSLAEGLKELLKLAGICGSRRAEAPPGGAEVEAVTE
jgi:DNA-binding MarR family transcriptional regulator